MQCSYFKDGFLLDAGNKVQFSNGNLTIAITHAGEDWPWSARNRFAVLVGADGHTQCGSAAECLVCPNFFCCKDHTISSLSIGATVNTSAPFTFSLRYCWLI